MNGLALGLAVTIPLLVLGLVTAFLLFLMRASRPTVKVLRTVAAELGLTDIQLIPDVQSAISGRIDRFLVTVTEVSQHPEERTANQDALQRLTEIVVEGAVAGGLEMKPEPRGLNRLLSWQPPDVLTGDDRFDDAVRVTGEPDLVLALLDRETRAAAAKALGEGVRLRGGQLFVVLPGRPGPVPMIVARARQLLALAHRLTPPADLVPPLARTALEDPVGAVRARALELLADRHGNRSETVDTLRRALHDPAFSVRLIAAVALSEEGRPTLLAMTEQAEAPLELATRAAVALASHLPLDTATKLLDRALATNEPALAAALVNALGASEDTRAGDRLTELLGHHSVELCVAAATALEQVGSVAAVPALRAAAERHGGSRRLRQAVAAAIASIQGRATGATPGQLSLSGRSAGEVAIVDGDSGDLSLVDDA